jgi:hypothetical protein
MTKLYEQREIVSRTSHLVDNIAVYGQEQILSWPVHHMAVIAKDVQDNSK